MRPDPTRLLEIAAIENPLVGFYDVPDPKPFEPFVRPERCFFSYYENWQKGESICISENGSSCRGGGYWIGGVEFKNRDNFAKDLNEREGFKSSQELMEQWLDNQKPYRIEHGYVVIGPLRDEQYDFLKTVTFFVNPDQLSLLLLGTEYHNASVDIHPAFTAFGSGCGQLAALFENHDPDIPKAIIGATDIAMRVHLPPDILALTVNKPMYGQLCELDEDSFLYKSFWRRLRRARGVAMNEAQSTDGK
ncbi:MAG: DUF169 domain-containing protein [Candidatus Undinarchaeales archaeon]|jgi:hypothetical protein|nr:DUF169 domain-containing protein [Candidatus Undinarchaeales archaeon]MDP7494391.1 DUF169 domain-containing protein [Candidatus Undinarchaeales archaeon]